MTIELVYLIFFFFFFFQAEDGIRDVAVTGVQTCALPIFSPARKVLSITLPSSMRRSFVRTKAPPLPGLTCWNSTIFQTLPSISIWLPLRNWFVLTDMAGDFSDGL